MQVSLGFGAGQFEKVEYSCDGSAVSSQAASYRAGGTLVEYWWDDPNYRLSASAGLIAFDAGSNGFAAIQLAREGARGGIGLGVALEQMAALEYSSARTELRPSTYLRIGSRDGAHVRADTYYPTFAPGMTGESFRIGVGFNRMGDTRAAGFFGFGWTPYSESGVFGEFTVPVSSQLGITVAGRTQRSHEHGDGGLGVGVRYQLRP